MVRETVRRPREGWRIGEGVDDFFHRRELADEWKKSAAMRGAISPSTRRPYPLTMICQTWRRARSSVYLTARPRKEAGNLSKRGPRPAVNEAEMLGAIREILQ